MGKNKGKIIQNIIILALILAAAFLSQQPYFINIGGSLYPEAQNYWIKSTDWVKNNIYNKLVSEVEKRGEEVKKEVETQKDNAVKSFWEKIKNYFAEKFSKFSGTKVE